MELQVLKHPPPPAMAPRKLCTCEAINLHPARLAESCLVSVHALPSQGAHEVCVSWQFARTHLAVWDSHIDQHHHKAMGFRILAQTENPKPCLGVKHDKHESLTPSFNQFNSKPYTINPNFQLVRGTSPSSRLLSAALREPRWRFRVT